MAHDHACNNLCDGFKQFVSALATCVNERKESDALGIFVEITTPVSCYHLNVSDIFARVKSLNLALQKSGESLVLADIRVYLDKTMSFFGIVKVCKQKTFLFNNLFNFSKEAMASLPPSSCTQ